MSPEQESCTVLLSQPEAHDVMALAKALSAFRKTPLQDQMFIAKNSWGFLAEKINADEAKRLADALRTAGIESRVCPSAKVPVLPPAEPAKTLEVLSEEAPALLCTAAISVTTTTTKLVKEGPSAAQKIASTGLMLATGLPIRIGGKERTVEKKQEHSDLLLYLDALWLNPLRLRRVNAMQFDYSFLKDRKLYQVMGNFKLLVGDMVQKTPSAWKNLGTRVLLEGKPLQTMGYQSLADFERETRWLLTLKTT